MEKRKGTLFRVLASRATLRVHLPFSLLPFLFSILFALALSASAVPASAAGRVECSALRSTALSRAVKYCAILPPSFDTEKTRTYPVLYWLHGLGENEQTFVDFGGWNLVENLQTDRRIGDYVIEVVAIAENTVRTARVQVLPAADAEIGRAHV